MYDYIVGAGGGERSREPEGRLAWLKRLLKDTGKFMIDMGKHFAVRHFCVEKDSFYDH